MEFMVAIARRGQDDYDLEDQGVLAKSTIRAVFRGPSRTKRDDLFDEAEEKCGLWIEMLAT